MPPPVNRTRPSPLRSVAFPGRERAGFSLIELLSVLVVMGILTVIAAPRIDFRLPAMEGAMEVAGSSVMKAQRLAVQGQHNVILAVDVEGARLRIHLDRNNNRGMDATEPVQYEPLGEAVRVGRGGAPKMTASEEAVTFTGEQDGWPAIVFYRNGSASEEGVLYLTTARGADSEDHAGDTRALRIDRATGRPSWFRYSPPKWLEH